MQAKVCIGYCGYVQLEQALSHVQIACAQLGYPADEKLETIVNYCVSHDAFPQADKLANPARYFAKYVDRYYAARNRSQTLGVTQTQPDPAVDVILRSFAEANDTLQIEQHHRLSMSAENLLGNLLERYIASKVEDHGWVWCAGNTALSVDFISNDFKVLLQVKNRDNSENSSSSKVRQGTPIQKWFRIFSRTAKTNWGAFPLKSAGLSEAGFHRFIEQYALGVK